MSTNDDASFSSLQARERLPT